MTQRPVAVIRRPGGIVVARGYPEFNPDQARDEHGQWTEEGAAPSGEEWARSPTAQLSPAMRVFQDRMAAIGVAVFVQDTSREPEEPLLGDDPHLKIIPESVLGQIHRAYARVDEALPGLLEGSTLGLVRADDPLSYASATGPNTISSRQNKVWLDIEDFASGSMKRDLSPPWSPELEQREDTLAGVVIHELGHVYHRMLKANAEAGFVAVTLASGQVAHVWDQASGFGRVSTLMDLNWGIKYRAAAGPAVSSYAQRNERERFAETVKALFFGSVERYAQHPDVLTVKGIVEQVGTKFLTPRPLIDISTLSGRDLIKARVALNTAHVEIYGFELPFSQETLLKGIVQKQETPTLGGDDDQLEGLFGIRDLLKIADYLEGVHRRAFLRIVRTVQQSVREALERSAARLELGTASVPEVLAEVETALMGQARWVAQPVRAAFLAAAQVAGARLGLTNSFLMVNPLAVEWAERRSSQLIRDVSQETKRQVQTLVSESIREGVPIRDLTRQITHVVTGLTMGQTEAVAKYNLALLAQGMDPIEAGEETERYANKLLKYRAEVIARTEIVRSLNEGQLALWKAALAEGTLDVEAQKIWITRFDERPDGGPRYCQLCADLNGERVPILEPFPAPPEWDDPERDELMVPPLHPQCLLGNARIAPGGQIAAQSTRWYEGEVVEISTTAGQQLTCTPNHPILTPQGWMPAGALHEGSHVVRSLRPEWVASVSGDDNQQMPSRIEKVAHTFRQAREVATAEVPVTSEDFHGDGRGSQIAVVRADLVLRQRLNPTLREHLLEQGFQWGPRELEAFARRGQAAEMLQGVRAPARRGVRSAHLTCPRCGRHRRPLHPFGVGSPAQGDTTFTQKQRDLAARDTQLVRQLLHGGAGQIAFDRVLRVVRRPHAGYVYNVETVGGWYIAEGIVTHNCRCSAAVIPAGATSVDEAIAQSVANIVEDYRRSRPKRKKHYGPGEHPSGSPQEVHAGGEGGGEGKGSAPHEFMTRLLAAPPMERNKLLNGASDDPTAQQFADEVADAPHTVAHEVSTFQAKMGDWQEKDTLDEEISTRLTDAEERGLIAEDAGNKIGVFVGDLLSSLGEQDLSLEDQRWLARSVTDHLLVQEIESSGRVLGDHGIRHLDFDATTAWEFLQNLPGEDNPRDRLAILLAASYHDTGYLTPPGKNFADNGHWRWGAQYVESTLGPRLRRLFGDTFTDQVLHMIATHGDTTIDWKNDPIGSAFRVADNLSLFGTEKLPSFVRYTPGGTGLLRALAKGEATVEQTQAAFRERITASSLPSALKSRFLNAVKEINSTLPKFTLGMLGGRVEDSYWNPDKHELVVEVTRLPTQTPLSTALVKMGADLGVQQFRKMAKTYGYDDAALAEAFKKNDIKFTDPKTGSRLRLVVHGPRLVQYGVRVVSVKWPGARVTRHMGPGEHPSGSPQEVHAGGEGGGEKPSEGTAKKKPYGLLPTAEGERERVLLAVNGGEGAPGGPADWDDLDREDQERTESRFINVEQDRLRESEEEFWRENELDDRIREVAVEDADWLPDHIDAWITEMGEESFPFNTETLELGLDGDAAGLAWKDEQQAELFPRDESPQEVWDRVYREKWETYISEALSEDRETLEEKVEVPDFAERAAEQAREAWDELDDEERLRLAVQYRVSGGELLVSGDRLFTRGEDGTISMTPAGVILNTSLERSGLHTSLADLIEAFTPKLPGNHQVRLGVKQRGYDIKIQANILDEDGEKRGMVEYTIPRTSGGSDILEHDLLWLDKNVQGAGIGSLYTIAVDRWAREAGIKEIHLTSVSRSDHAITGHQMWPLQGFTWRNQEGAATIRTAITTTVKAKYGEASPEFAQIQAMEQRSAPAWEYAHYVDTKGKTIGFDLLNLNKIGLGHLQPSLVRSLVDKEQNAVWHRYERGVLGKVTSGRYKGQRGGHR